MEHSAPRRPSRYALPDGTEWRYEYDDDGRLVAEVDPTGARTTYERDGNVETTTDPAGRRTSTEYDAAGLPVRVTDALGAETRYAYDALGQVTEVVDPLGGTTRLTWNAGGGLVELVGPDGARERYSYDGEGNLVRSESARGGTATAEYGYFDVPLATRTAASGRLEFAYDTESRVVGVTNELGLRWGYERDAAGRLVREVDFDGREQRFTTDAAGRVTGWVNASGQDVELTRDALGRPVERRTREGVTTFHHDAVGRLVRASGPDVDLSRTYDAVGRLVTETVNGRTLRTEYDVVGRRIRTTTPSGAESTWDYDDADRPVALRSSGRTIGFDYDPLGRETGRVFGAVRVDQEWDAGWRLRSQTLSNGAQRRSYAYRQDGTLIGVEDALRGELEYEVDGPGRVTAVRGGHAEEHYAYDGSGLLVDSALGEHVHVGLELRRAGDLSYEHDADGRVVRREEGGRVWSFRWDALDQLVAVLTPEGEHWQYRYDPFGRRIAKQRVTADGGAVLDRVEFTWDGTDLVEQSQDGAVVVWDRLPGRSLPVSQVERAVGQDWADARFRAVVTDLVGTPAELLDEQGAVTWHARHTLWGGGSPDADGTPLRFPGQYHDRETGLHQNFHRYYDPATGRYASKDPLGLAVAADPRSYVLNPTGWIDPLGLAPCPVAEFDKIHRSPEGPSLILRGPDHTRRLDLGSGRVADALRNAAPNGVRNKLGPGANKFTDRAAFDKIANYARTPDVNRGKMAFDRDGSTLVEINAGTLLGNDLLSFAWGSTFRGGKGSDAVEFLGRSDPKTRKFWERQDLRDRHVAEDVVARNKAFTPDPARNADVDTTLNGSTSRVDGVTDLLGRYDGVAIGGSHNASHPVFDVLTNNMQDLKDAGVNKIFMESLRNDAHGDMVEDFLRTGTMDPRLDRFLTMSTNNQQVRAVLVEARARDIDVIGIGGNPARRVGDTPDAGLFRRHAMLNALGAESVEFHQKRNPGKFVVELGAKHLERSDWVNWDPVRVGDVPLPHQSNGIGDLVGVPQIVDNGAGLFERAPHLPDLRR